MIFAPIIISGHTGQIKASLFKLLLHMFRCMLSVVNSVTLDIKNRETTFLITNNKLSLKTNPIISWIGSCNITFLSKVHRSDHLILLGISDNSGHILGIGSGDKIEEIAVFSPCPSTAYFCPPLTLIFEHESSCGFYNMEDRKKLINSSHSLLGYDFTTDRYVFRVKGHDDQFSQLNPVSGQLHSFQNDSLISVGSLPISWVSILSEKTLVLGTTLKRVMYVYEGVITSHYRIDHSIHYIARDLSGASVSVRGNSATTDLTVPVLTLCVSQHKETVESSPMSQLAESCDNLIELEMQNLRGLYQLYEKKTEFLIDVWNNLFSAKNNIGKSTEVELITKRQRLETPLAANSNTQLKTNASENYRYYQIPRAPDRFTRTSTFLAPLVSVDCFYPAEELLTDREPCQECNLKLQSLCSPRTVDVIVNQEFHEKLRKMFVEAIASQRKSFELDALAYLVNIVLSVDNGKDNTDHSL